MNLGNTTLIQHGIFEDESDLRVHVGVLSHYVYIYPTQELKKKLADSNGTYKQQDVRTGDITTALGYWIPVTDIPRLRPIKIPQYIIEQADFHEDDSTADKGAKAVRVVDWLLKNGYLPLPVRSEEVTDFERQIVGQDIIVKANLRIQIKCDWKGGLANNGGMAGSLFIQTHECNPLKAY